MHTCMHIYTYIHTCVYSMYVYIYIYIYIHMNSSVTYEFHFYHRCHYTLPAPSQTRPRRWTATRRTRRPPP